MCDEIDNILRRIANHLLLHTSFIDDVGLYHGKMGVVLFFAHYSRYAKINLYDDFAKEMLEDIFSNIPRNIPINLEEGICGLGWGIEYLMSNGFLFLDDCSILYEIDRLIMERDLKYVSDFSLERGLSGISAYIRERLKSTDNAFDSLYINAWKLLNRSEDFNDDEKILFHILDFEYDINNLPLDSFGLSKGCAGIGLDLILKKMYGKS